LLHTKSLKVPYIINMLITKFRSYDVLLPIIQFKVELLSDLIALIARLFF